MTYYKLIVSYKGTRFSGWQKQNNDRPTIQSHLEDCLFKIFQNREIKTLASGRTDAGVHALGQVVRVSTSVPIPCSALKNALNALLVSDVRILEVSLIDSSFHPIRDAAWKEYCYLFSLSGWNGAPFFHQMVGHIGRNLDREKMQEAAQIFEGKYDFCNYRTTGGNSTTTWKRIYECRIESSEILFPLMKTPHPLYIFRVKGEGFLKQMVRLMVGAVAGVGRGKISAEDIRSSLQNPMSDRMGAVAPPQGLYLREVFYEKILTFCIG